MNVIVVCRLDPAFRSVLDDATTLGNLRAWGCGLRSLEEPWIDTNVRSDARNLAAAAACATPSQVTARSFVPLYRLGFAMLTLAAILVQMVSLIQAGTFDALNYFSYFTIDSNLIATAVLLVGAVRWRAETGAGWDLVRGAAVVYMIVVGVVFTVLLSGTDVDTATPWVNSVVHEVMPLVLVADWLLDPPRTRLAVRQAIVWLAFPLVWIVYTMIKGPIVGRYPYPFLDPANGGYGTVALYSLGILVFMLLVGAVVVWIGNARRSGGPAIA